MKVNVAAYHYTLKKEVEKMLKLKVIIEGCENIIKEKISNKCELNGIFNVYYSDATISILNKHAIVDVRMICTTYTDEFYDINVLFDEELNLTEIICKIPYKRVYENEKII